MPPFRHSERTIEAILQAAERLIAEKGVYLLTLDEVAARAGISKGGLLHHFASKQALILGLTERMLTLSEREIETHRARDPEPPGAFTRAFLRANLECADQCTQVCAALTAESRNVPGQRELFRKHSEDCQAKLESDGLDPVTATIVRYAAEGLMSASMWGMPHPRNYDEVVRRLLKSAGDRETKQNLL